MSRCCWSMRARAASPQTRSRRSRRRLTLQRPSSGGRGEAVRCAAGSLLPTAETVPVCDESSPSRLTLLFRQPSTGGDGSPDDVAFAVERNSLVRSHVFDAAGHAFEVFV